MGTGLSRLSSGTTLKHRLQVNLGILKRRGTAAVTEPPDGLSIGELARRTEVPAATLRSWEDRYGFPRPHRLAGGHRRYDQGDIGLIEAVVRLRASGMSLHAAIGQATSAAGQPEPSVFAGLRRRHPALIPQVLRKVTLLALTRAIEDECCAQAERPVLFAAFQRQRFFLQSQRRWNELARTARVMIAFADFGEPGAAGGPPPGSAVPIKVPLMADAPANSLGNPGPPMHADVSRRYGASTRRSSGTPPPSARSWRAQRAPASAPCSMPCRPNHPHPPPPTCAGPRGCSPG
jgi:DNA-binding transcriptional MerR regulator